MQENKWVQAKGGFRKLEVEQRCGFMKWYATKHENINKVELIELLCRLSNEPITKN